MADAIPNEQRAYGELYRMHYSRVVRLCRLLLADPRDAEEVAQEVFLKLLRGTPAGVLPLASRGWLTRVAINACRDRRRAAWWKLWRSRTEEFDESQFPAATPTPEQEVLRGETRRQIWTAFRCLSARQQEVFALHNLEGWSLAEIAEALDVSTGSVKRHLFRAVRQLRKAVGGYA